MPTPQDIIKAMVSSLHQRHLKGLGFRKSGKTWVRNSVLPQVINIQLSRSNSSNEAKFTINLGVFVEGLHKDGLPRAEVLTECECDVRSRIGRLLPDKQDKWWVVTARSDADQMVGEIFTAIREYGLPWLEKLINYSAVASEFKIQHTPHMAALVYALDGNMLDATECMAEAFATSNTYFLPMLKRLAKEHSIPIPGE